MTIKTQTNVHLISLSSYSSYAGAIHQQEDDLCGGWGRWAFYLDDDHHHHPHLSPQTQEKEAEKGAD